MPADEQIRHQSFFVFTLPSGCTLLLLAGHQSFELLGVRHWLVRVRRLCSLRFQLVRRRVRAEALDSERDYEHHGADEEQPEDPVQDIVVFELQIRFQIQEKLGFKEVKLSTNSGDKDKQEASFKRRT